jgi:2-phosphosulfolactate phosphatase
VDTVFDQHRFACRCEWGVAGVDALAPADVTIVVDVLSFSTCVDIAASRGAAILPYPFKGTSAVQFAREHQAEVALARGDGRYSLSPATFLDAPSGLRCVLPSPNGAELTLRAARGPTRVLAGCLRNAGAVAAAAKRMGRTFNVCPAGERWPDGAPRPAIEDWLGAGAILRALPGSRSPEASAAVATFEACAGELEALLRGSASGLELIARGYPADVELARALSVSDSVPVFDGHAYVAAS